MAVGTEGTGIDRLGCGTGWPRSIPVDASQNRTVESSLAVMIVFPSEQNATALTLFSSDAGPTG